MLFFNFTDLTADDLYSVPADTQEVNTYPDNPQAILAEELLIKDTLLSLNLGKSPFSSYLSIKNIAILLAKILIKKRADKQLKDFWQIPPNCIWSILLFFR